MKAVTPNFYMLDASRTFTSPFKGDAQASCLGLRVLVKRTSASMKHYTNAQRLYTTLIHYLHTSHTCTTLFHTAPIRLR